jgi:hypothetical protein
MRAVLAVNVRGTRAGGDLAEPLWVIRLRGGFSVSPTPWVTATARLAAFFDKDLDGVDFRVEHRGGIRAGDVTFDTLYLSVNPRDWLTIKVGRLQTQFEIDSVILDSLSRNDSGGVTVTWTDGVHAILGGPRSFRLHLIGQVNPEDGSTNGVGIRGPISFRDGTSRITYYAAAEAPPIGPFTQLLADATVIPGALRPSGLATEPTEHAVALTFKAAADFPTHGGPTSLILHPFAEVGTMLWTPRESAVGVSTRDERAAHFAVVAGLDLKRLGPGALGFQFAWVEPGYLMSPDYPNNTWSIETRYKVRVTSRAVLEFRYRHRQDADRLLGAAGRQIDDNLFVRLTLRY